VLGERRQANKPCSEAAALCRVVPLLDDVAVPESLRIRGLKALSHLSSIQGATDERWRAVITANFGVGSLGGQILAGSAGCFEGKVADVVIKNGRRCPKGRGPGCARAAEPGSG